MFNPKEVFHLVTTAGEMKHTIIGTYSSQENAAQSLDALKRINPKVASQAYIAQAMIQGNFICDDQIDEDEDIFEEDD
ncbi:hypothetical protein PBI_ANJALI_25 [Arthrobacter phage Anjali]|uniref:Uncharacterized protein n=1 Tax=Arthrobacter phage Anjali TaxID=2484217 RepID=A0A3G3LY20_9CAUD|nr:hypothetical protein HWB95_gp25 [Arthrobacter phage Anjali]AYQ98995.1 hypothetical protein PBI_ANJALI_25 [Arthrobacter phage Anjali]